MTFMELLTELCEIRQLCNRREHDEVTQRIYALIDRLTDLNGGIKR